MTASDYNGYNISCFGGNNGSIDLTITGGTPPYTILWSNDQVTEDIADLPTGYYRVRVDDADTLTMPVEAEITLSEPRRMDISYQAYQYPNGFNISVFGACNGSIDLSVTEGLPPYTYSWKDGPTTEDRSAVCASTYRVIVTDLNGCQASSESIFMKEPNRGDWQLDGNTSIDPNTQFIGSVDSTDLVFRTNNQERFRIGSNGQLTLGGEIFSFGGINFGDNKTIKYQPPGGGFPGIFSIGKDPSMDPFSISNCNPLTLNSLNYQFNGIIQLYGNSYAGGNLNIMELGFDGANAIIDATGMSQDPAANRLLLNSYCGRDVVVGNSTSGNFTASRDAFVNNKLGVNMGSTTIQKQFEVNGDVRLLANASDENNGFEISRGLNPPVRRGISIGNDPDGSFNFWINSNQPNNSFNFIQYNESTSSNSNLLKIMGNGDVAIGSLPESGYKLTVCGGIISTKIRVNSTTWCDFVFDNNYNLMSLKDVKQFIIKNSHLPAIPNADEIINNGLDLGEITKLQMQKIEELFLYIIKQDEEIAELKAILKANNLLK